MKDCQSYAENKSVTFFLGQAKTALVHFPVLSRLTSLPWLWRFLTSTLRYVKLHAVIFSPKFEAAIPLSLTTHFASELCEVSRS